jgi:hypothetical protein
MVYIYFAIFLSLHNSDNYINSLELRTYQGSNLRLALLPRASNYVVRASSREGPLARRASRIVHYLQRIKVLTGQVDIWSGQVNQIGHLPEGKWSKKLSSIPAYIYFIWTLQ